MSAPAPGPARHFIGGQFVDWLSGEWFDHVNPATELPTVPIAKGDSADVDRAVTAAKETFADGAWSRAKLHRDPIRLLPTHAALTTR